MLTLFSFFSHFFNLQILNLEMQNLQLMIQRNENQLSTMEKSESQKSNLPEIEPKRTWLNQWMLKRILGEGINQIMDNSGLSIYWNLRYGSKKKRRLTKTISSGLRKSAPSLKKSDPGKDKDKSIKNCCKTTFEWTTFHSLSLALPGLWIWFYRLQKNT